MEKNRDRWMSYVHQNQFYTGLSWHLPTDLWSFSLLVIPKLNIHHMVLEIHLLFTVTRTV